MIPLRAMKRGVWILCLGMFVPGLTMLLPGSTLQALITYFSLTKFEAGFIGTSFSAGGLIGILGTSALMSKLGARRSLALCCGVSAASLAAMAFAHHFYVLLSLYFILGTVFGVLVTLPGVVVSALMSEGSAGPMNLVYGFFACGVIFEPIVAGWMLKRGMPWWAPYMLPAAAAGITSLIAISASQFPEPPTQSPLSLKVIVEVWNEKPVVLLVGVVGTLLYISSEMTLNFWVPKFLLDTFPADETIYRVNIILTLFWVGLTAGRWVSSAFLSRHDPARFLVALSLLGGITVGVAPYLGVHWAVEGAIVLAGFWYAAMYPTLMSYTGMLKPHQSGAAFSIMAAGGQVGATILPPIAGGIAQTGRFSLAISITAVPLITLALLLIILIKRRLI